MQNEYALHAKIQWTFNPEIQVLTNLSKKLQVLEQQKRMCAKLDSWM